MIAAAPHEVITIPFDKMSRDDLLEVATIQQAQLKRIFELRAIPNTHLSPTEKLIQWAGYEVLSKEKPDQQGRVRFDPAPIAELTGMSEASVLRNSVSLCERFGATRAVEPYTTKAGQKCNLVYVVPADPLWADVTQATPAPEKLRNLPGDDRRVCASCGTEMQKKMRILRRQRTWVCPGCGEQHALKAEDVLPELEVTHSEDEALHVVDLSESPKLSDLPPVAEEENEGLQHVDLSSEELAAEDSASLYVPLTPPLAPGEYPLNGFSLEDLLRQRIGHGQVIVSTGKLDQAAKYITKPKDYTPDIQAHIAGNIAHIYGSRPALPDGTTSHIGMDCDTPELDAQHLEWMKQLAAAGIPSIYWKRRPGRGHLEVYFATPIDRKAAYAHLISVCPSLAAIPEVFPIGNDQNTDGVDRADFGYSWPLYYRLGNQVIECEAEVMLPDVGKIMKSTGIRSDRNRLTWLISQAITPAALIPELPLVAQAHNEATMPVGVLMDKRPGGYKVGNSDGLAKVVIAEFDALSWEEIVAPSGGVSNSRFRAKRGGRFETSPSVVINKDDRTATDYGRTDSGKVETWDKYEWYCRLRGIDKGQDLKQRCAEYRNQARIAS